MEWIETKHQNPPFNKLVVVWCIIYGKYFATYEEIGDTGYGSWRDNNGNLGVLPPVYWIDLPELPNK